MQKKRLSDGRKLKLPRDNSTLWNNTVTLQILYHSKLKVARLQNEFSDGGLIDLEHVYGGLESRPLKDMETREHDKNNRESIKKESPESSSPWLWIRCYIEGRWNLQ